LRQEIRASQQKIKEKPMFGKRSMSSTARFVMQKGVEAGNLKGRGTAAKIAPLKKAPPAKTMSKLTIGPMKDRPVSPGKFGTFSTGKAHSGAIKSGPKSRVTAKV
jgi:hypothetical protein